MGNYRARRPGFLKGWQIQAAEYMFEGMQDKEIAGLLFKTDVNDPVALKRARQKLSSLRKNEKFQEYYKSIITEWSVHNVGKALSKLSEQIDSDKPWIANKAANDVLLHSKDLVKNAEDNTVVLRMECGVELGTPDEE